MSTNNVSVSAVNIDNAPLDVTKLSQIGRYQLRRLAEELTRNGIPLVDTEERRTSFMALPNAQAMAEAVFEGLKKYREDNGEELAKPRVTQSQQELADVAVEAPKAPEEEAKPKRSPRTASSIRVSEDVPPVAKVGDVVRVEGVVRTVSEPSIGADILKAIEATSALTGQVALGFNELKNTLCSQSAQAETIRDLDERTAALERKMDVALGLLTLIAENVLNASQSQVIQDAHETVQNVDFLPKDEE